MSLSNDWDELDNLIDERRRNKIVPLPPLTNFDVFVNLLEQEFIYLFENDMEYCNVNASPREQAESHTRQIAKGLGEVHGKGVQAVAKKLGLQNHEIQSYIIK